MAFSFLGRPLRRPPSIDDDPPTDDGTVRLDDVRRRLEILLAALYGRPIPIATSRAEPPPGVLDRVFRRPPPHLRGVRATASTDGERIHLPAELPPEPGGADALARYRLLAIEQAERMRRGTPLHAPEDDALARDLYLLAEGAAVDRAITRDVPGVRAALRAERTAALSARPALDALTPAEREVEALVRSALLTDGAEEVGGPAPGSTPEETAAWARERAASLRALHAGAYRGVTPVAAWGKVAEPTPAVRVRAVERFTPPPPRATLTGVGIGGQGGKSARGSARPAEGMDADQGLEGKTQDAARKSSGKGKSKGTGEAADPKTGADRPDDPEGTEEGDGERTGAPDPSAEPETDHAATVRVRVAAARSAPPADSFTYPEWDAWAGRYVPAAATVRLSDPEPGDPDWAADELRRHAAVVRRLREQFERLRARRTRLRQQRDGEELDLAACVSALVDLRTGHTVDDRLYSSVRPARREMSILLLVDVSGSTVEPVNATGARIIDVEKTALLLTGEALDALGDRWAVLTFSGRTANDVRMRTIKGFAERGGDPVRRRIAALQPEGYTRLGAAVRHATGLLAAQGTTHRLLLILSDGKPNDDDHYQGRYAVEDSRQAIAEARDRGVFPFCLTVDRAGAAYLARIFGAPGHMILRRPDQLPLALTRVVRHILGA
ncbi:MAG: von Willebrand factor, type [Gemmatimonadetes bacterium]|nr:von Willebrand factor, type [Gemmatimonadota bacterium]